MDQQHKRDPKSEPSRSHKQNDRGQGQEAVPSHPFAGTTPAASRYTPGSATGGVTPGGMSAADLTGGGAGGDIDTPDITGRGTTPDLIRAAQTQRAEDAAKEEASRRTGHS